MRVRHHVARFLAVTLIAFATVLALPQPAWARTLQIRDDAHVLAPGDVERLRSAVASEPFDARLVFTSDYANAEDLSRFVGSLLDEPNMVAVGVDPRHRHVQVHFGRGTGIARAEWPAIETAGTGAFHDGNWADGATAIFRTAAESAKGVPASESPSGAGQAIGVGSVLMVLLVVGGVVVLIGLLARARSSYGPGGPGYGGPGYGGGPYGPGPYGAPPPGGMGPVGGGLIGAGLGGLAGYELGKLEGERERSGRADESNMGTAKDDNFDAGGGGSSWDDGGGGGGDGGGFDGGGGGDGGGGSDF